MRCLPGSESWSLWPRGRLPRIGTSRVGSRVLGETGNSSLCPVSGIGRWRTPSRPAPSCLCPVAGIGPTRAETARTIRLAEPIRPARRARPRQRVCSRRPEWLTLVQGLRAPVFSTHRSGFPPPRHFRTRVRSRASSGRTLFRWLRTATQRVEVSRANSCATDITTRNPDSLRQVPHPDPNVLACRRLPAHDVRQVVAGAQHDQPEVLPRPAPPAPSPPAADRDAWGLYALAGFQPLGPGSRNRPRAVVGWRRWTIE